MKVITLENLRGSDRDVKCPKGGFRSLRALIQSDGMGFGLHQTLIPRGEPQHWQYKHHLEACYCVSGRGELRDLTTGNVYRIIPGVLYVLDHHDDHTFQAFEDTVLISVFNPPVTGQEVHDETGSYQPQTTTPHHVTGNHWE